jgi:hypothetical protein
VGLACEGFAGRGREMGGLLASGLTDFLVAVTVGGVIGAVFFGDLLA